MLKTIKDRAWLWHGSNLDLYPKLGNVDHVITDPPYSASTHRYDRWARNEDGEIAEVGMTFDALGDNDALELAAFCGTRIKRGWALIFSDLETLGVWRGAARYGDSVEGGEMRFNRANIWVKTNPKPNMSGRGPGVGYEFVSSFWCGGGHTSWNGGGKAGVFTHNGRGTKSHPTEKPLSLMRELIQLFTNPGDVIFDPFMGSGTTGVAALECGRRFIGAELDAGYFETAVKRMADVREVPALVRDIGKARPVRLFDGVRTMSNIVRAKEQKRPHDERGWQPD